MWQSTPTEDNCEFCKKRREEKYMICDVCLHSLWIPPEVNFSGNNIPGYSAPGYNEGLGVEIRSKKHFDEVCKEKGVRQL